MPWEPRVIRDRRGEPFAEPDRKSTNALLAAEQARLSSVHRKGGRAIGPYGPRDLMAGDPASPGGTKVTCEELDADECIGGGGGTGVQVRERDGDPDVNPATTITVPNDSLTETSPGVADLDYATSDQAFEVREVVLVFAGATTPLPANTTINIQTGVYGGVGSPATVKGDSDVTLPASAALFDDDGRIEAKLNGVELDKGVTIVWVSTTQVRLPSCRIFQGNKLTIRAPVP